MVHKGVNLTWVGRHTMQNAGFLDDDGKPVDVDTSAFLKTLTRRGSQDPLIHTFISTHLYAPQHPYQKASARLPAGIF